MKGRKKKGGQWWNQISILCIKQFLLSIRNWKGSVGQILAPVIIVILLFGFQKLSDLILSQSQEFPPIQQVANIPKCVNGGTSTGCITILYSPKDCLWVDSIMKMVADENGLKFGEDVVSIGGAKLNFQGFFADNTTLYNHIVDNQNATAHAVMFTSAYDGLHPVTMPKDPGYILLYNYTQAKADKYWTTGFNVMKYIDQAILSLQTNSSAKIGASTQDYPRAQLRFTTGYDVVAANGGVWFYIPPMVTFFILLTEIVMEKENKLRLGMKLMGLKDSAYWVSWFITGLIFAFLTSWILIAAAFAFQFSVFKNTNVGVMFLTFFVYSLSIQSVAYLLSAIISRSKTAQTVGYAIILIGFVFQSILASGYGLLVDLLYSDGTPGWVVFIRIVFQFYPPFNFAKLYSDIAALSSDTIDWSEGKLVEGPGFYWKDLYQQRVIPKFFSFPNITVPPPIHSIYYLLMNFAVYAVLTWYLDNVLSGDHGSPRPFYFFLTPDYWGFSRSSKRRSGIPTPTPSPSSEAEAAPLLLSSKQEVSEEDSGGGGYDSDVQLEKEAVSHLNTSESQGLAVVLHSLVKSYKKGLLFGKTMTAVDHIHVKVEPQETLCLLGHNGAGKTTTINMLTGLFPPTSGEATIFGLDIVHDMDAIRDIIGITPQHDILWNELTAREHLKLFAKLKNIPKHLVEQEITQKLQKVDLLHVADVAAGTFSGGMKRRLSIAIATLGNPKLLFLDEPSTGLDPVNRASLWNLIQELKKNSAIILTTHQMEEADILADRVAIMAFGKIRCIGTPLHLKHRYGLGYRIEVMTPPSASSSVIADVMKQLPTAVLAGEDAGNLSFSVPKAQAQELPSFMKYLEHSSHIKEWGVSHTTLEEVFLNVTKQHHFEYSDPELKDDIPAAVAPSSSVNDPQPISSQNSYHSYPFRALLRKNFSLQKRQLFTNICQTVTPIFVMILLVILQVIIRAEVPGGTYTRELIPTFPWPLNVDQAAFSVPFHSEALFESAFHNPYQHPLTSPLPPAPRGGFPTTTTTTMDKSSVSGNGECYIGVIYGGSPSDKVEELIKKIPSWNCTLPPVLNSSVISVPVMTYYDTLEAMESYVYTTQLQYNAAPLPDVSKPPMSYALPDGYFYIYSMNQQSLEYVMTMNDLPLNQYHHLNNVTLAYVPLLNRKLQVFTESRFSMMSLVHEAFRHWSTNSTPPNPNQLSSVFTLKWVQAMPYYAVADILAYLEAVGTILYPVALTLQLPVYIYLLVVEKSGAKELMKAHGLKAVDYFISHFIFDMSLYGASIVFFWGVGAAIQIRFFAQTHFSVLLLFFVGWGLAMISLAFFLSTVLNTTRASTVIGYIIALMGSLMGIVICVGIYGAFPFSLATTLPWGFLVWPQFAFVRGIYLMNYACAAEYACYGPITTLSWSNELAPVLLALYLDAIVLGILAMYLEQVFPRTTGVPKHPLFMFQNCFRKSDIPIDKNYSPPNPSIPEDSDVTLQREAVNADKYDVNQAPLVLNNLTKVYTRNKVPKIAVNHLCLVVEKGECFGLLGENGAGKTTTISMATGFQLPTSGTAFVASHDVRSDIEKVHLSIGVCPQFSILWEGLTVQEHLLFYARLKGISPSHEVSHVDQSLKSFGLTSVKERQAQELSGGMQRRLSVAIALVGHSQIVFLDEPTTGLDPASKRQLWKIIHAAKSNRAIILTTHNMTEAELLCQRVSIMTDGEMRCLGTPLHLKNKFADGFRLLVNVPVTLQSDILEALSQQVPGVQLMTSYKASMELKIVNANPNLNNNGSSIGSSIGSSNGGVSISQLFGQLQKFFEERKVEDWSLNQIGLEQVFQSIVHSYKLQLLSSSNPNPNLNPDPSSLNPNPVSPGKTLSIQDH